MNNQEIVGMNSAYEHAKQCAYGANMSISAALVVDMVKRIAELEKEASNTNGLWVTSNDLQVWKLEQQVCGIEVAVRLNLKSYSDPYVIKLMNRAAELRSQAKALKEQG